MAATTRRSISVKGLTYQRLKRHADSQKSSLSGLLEELIEEKLNELGVPQETVLLPRASSNRPRVTDSGHFTF